MRINRAASLESGSTRVQIDVISSSSVELRDQDVTLTEKALPIGDQGYFTFVLGRAAADTIVFYARPGAWPDALAPVHDVLCTTYGGQPLYYEQDGEEFMRGSDGEVHQIEPTSIE